MRRPSRSASSRKLAPASSMYPCPEVGVGGALHHGERRVPGGGGVRECVATKMGNYCAMANREDLQRQIGTLERALRDAVKQAETVETALDDLEGHRNELSGRLAIARQAEADYAARLEELSQELARALEAETQAKVLEAVGTRDDAGNRAAEAIAQLIVSFERLDAARDEMAERVAEAESHLRRRIEVEPEPEKLEQEWARLIDFIGTRAQLRLDDKLVDAAASDPTGFEIQKLPQHLQVIARQRRRERMASESHGGSEAKRE